MKDNKKYNLIKLLLSKFKEIKLMFYLIHIF